MQKELLWIWLSEAFYKGGRKPKLAVDSLGSVEAVYAAKRDELARIPYFREKDIAALENKSLNGAEKILSDCVKKKIRVICPDGYEYPKRLWQIHDAPAVLYAKGNTLDIDNELAVAIVGTRNASKNGEVATDRIAYDLAAHGVLVVSGLAKGIDTIAASAAIRAGGRTIAVFGCGPDVIYPAENRSLATKVEREGTILSEFPPGVRPNPKFFPMRNRIISGLSIGTLVTEAPEKSGALITAKCALDQDRDVFAVPSGIFEKSAEGTNNLIKQGGIPVTSAGDILAEYARTYGDKIKFRSPPKPEKKEPEKITKTEAAPKKDSFLESFAGDEKKVMSALCDGAETVDEIVRKSGLGVPQVLSTLTLLEIRGHIKRQPGNKFRIKV